MITLQHKHNKGSSQHRYITYINRLIVIWPSKFHKLVSGWCKENQERRPRVGPVRVENREHSALGLARGRGWSAVRCRASLKPGESRHDTAAPDSKQPSVWPAQLQIKRLIYSQSRYISQRLNAAIKSKYKCKI